MRRGRIGIFVTLACLGAYVFFGWHAEYGARSFGYQRSVREKLARIRAERDRLAARRMALEARVALLRPESLDADMLDEMARKMLAFSRPDEIVSFSGK